MGALSTMVDGKLFAARLGVASLTFAIILTCGIFALLSITDGSERIILQEEPQNKEMEFDSSVSFVDDPAAPAAKPSAKPPKVVKPLISKSAKVRAKLEKARLKATEEKRVKVTIAKAKLSVVREHDAKKMARSKARNAAKVKRATEKGVKFTHNRIVEEKTEKSKIHKTNLKTYEKIHKIFAKIKSIKGKVVGSIKIKAAKLKASLKTKMAKLTAELQLKAAKQKAVEKMALAKVNAAELKQKAKNKASAAERFLKRKAIRMKDASEKQGKVKISAVSAAKRKIIKLRAAVKLRKIAAKENAQKERAKTHPAGGAHIHRLARRAIRLVHETAREADRKHKRKVAYTLRKFRKAGRNGARSVRAVARKAYGVIRRLSKERKKKAKLKNGESKKKKWVKHPLGPIEKQAQRAEYKYGAAKRAAALAWKHTLATASDLHE